MSLGVTAVLVATLSGCSALQEEYDYGGVCADGQTQLRVDDYRCDDDDGYHRWYYIPTGRLAQPVGERVSGGSFYLPSSSERAYRGGVPSEGGEVSRGGFGGKSESVGG